MSELKIYNVSEPYQIPGPGNYYLTTQTIESQPGCWNWTRVKIYSKFKDEPILEYDRDYDSHTMAKNSVRTFQYNLGAPIYILYSDTYLSYKVRHMGTDEVVAEIKPESCNHIPVDIYIPTYHSYKFSKDEGRGFAMITNGSKNVERDTKDWASSGDQHNMGNLPMAFVAGCVWGDDSSMKLKVLDLRRIKEGVLEFDESIGYHELPYSYSMSELSEIIMELDGPEFDLDKFDPLALYTDCIFSIPTDKIYYSDGFKARG